MLRYVELKSGFNDNGPAWIAHVTLSRSGRTVYFNGLALMRGNGGAFSNHFDFASRDHYWISGIKKDGFDRHWAGSGKVMIEETTVAEYLSITGAKELDRSKFSVIPPLPPTDVAEITKRINASSEPLGESPEA